MKNNNKSGMVLAIIMITGVILLILMAALLPILQPSLSLTSKAITNRQAFLNAKSGLEYTRAKLANQDSLTAYYHTTSYYSGSFNEVGVLTMTTENIPSNNIYVTYQIKDDLASPSYASLAIKAIGKADDQSISLNYTGTISKTPTAPYEDGPIVLPPEEGITNPWLDDNDQITESGEPYDTPITFTNDITVVNGYINLEAPGVFFDKDLTLNNDAYLTISTFIASFSGDINRGSNGNHNYLVLNSSPSLSSADLKNTTIFASDLIDQSKLSPDNNTQYGIVYFDYNTRIYYPNGKNYIMSTQQPGNYYLFRSGVDLIHVSDATGDPYSVLESLLTNKTLIPIDAPLDFFNVVAQEFPDLWGELMINANSIGEGSFN